MSKVVGDKMYIFVEKPNQCELCGKTAELRPYGPNGENICFECGMKNKATTDEAFEKRIKNVNTVIVVKGQ